jgi:hypothetical protein
MSFPISEAAEANLLHNDEDALAAHCDSCGKPVVVKWISLWITQVSS